MRSHHTEPGRREAQKKLALEVTELVHGDAARSAMVASDVLFGNFDPHNANGRVFDALAQEIPTTTVPRTDGLTLVDALVKSGLTKSKSEARLAIEQGGVYLNQQRVKEGERVIGRTDWLADQNILLRKGKKDYALLRAER
jgi:tyrosyl-tRNA synthetase